MGRPAFLRGNKFAVTTGLDLLEARLEDTTYHTLDWANVASNAMTETLTGQDATRYADGGNFNWTKLTQEALIATAGSLILNNKYGEDAGLSFLGHKLGTLTVGVIESNAEIARNLQQQATALEALAASFTQSLTERPVSAEAQRAWLNASSAGGPGAPSGSLPPAVEITVDAQGRRHLNIIGGQVILTGRPVAEGETLGFGVAGAGIAPGGGATTGAETGSAPVIPQVVNPGAIPKDGTQIMSPDIQAVTAAADQGHLLQYPSAAVETLANALGLSVQTKTYASIVEITESNIELRYLDPDDTKTLARYLRGGTVGGNVPSFVLVAGADRGQSADHAVRELGGFLTADQQRSVRERFAATEAGTPIDLSTEWTHVVKEAYAARTVANVTRGVSGGILRQGLRSGDLWTMHAGVAGNVAAGIQETVGLAFDSRTPPSIRTEAQLDTAFLAVTAPVPWSRLAGLGRGLFGAMTRVGVGVTDSWVQQLVAQFRSTDFSKQLPNIRVL